MPTESALLSLLSVISLVSFFIVLLMVKFSNRINNGILLDRDFKKPQAFHKDGVARSGGLASIISLSIFFILSNFLFQQLFLSYFVLSVAMFCLGFAEDLKIKFSPSYRLVLMVIILIIFISFFSINIQTIDLRFLNTWLDSTIFSTAFIVLCFLFIANGSA